MELKSIISEILTNENVDSFNISYWESNTIENSDYLVKITMEKEAF